MSKFFDKNKLTKEQLERWDWAVLKYRDIREKNNLHSFEQMSEDEKLHLMKDLAKAKEFKGALTFDIVDEKSALFSRLLDGKKPLIYPPPCSYSYPWYEVIEESGPFDLSLEARDIEEIIWDNLTEERQVLIEQTPWQVIEQVSDNELKVTFGKWQDIGFEWILKKVKTSCEKTKSFIYCHYKDNIGRITNYIDLKNEQMYQTKKEFDKIKLVLDTAFQDKYKLSLYEKYGATAISESIFYCEIKAGEQLLSERRQKNLSDYPGNEELNTIVEKKINDYFNSGYSVDENGKLFVEVWILEKVAGEVTEDIYMKI